MKLFFWGVYKGFYRRPGGPCSRKRFFRTGNIGLLFPPAGALFRRRSILHAIPAFSPVTYAEQPFRGYSRNGCSYEKEKPV
ncbi:hypothetical protein CXU21_11640 [Akkermansia muciniphila]|nr:hypothetical protein CXU21_11640 [Akkermansia muciniphila]